MDSILNRFIKDTKLENPVIKRDRKGVFDYVLVNARSYKDLDLDTDKTYFENDYFECKIDNNMFGINIYNKKISDLINNYTPKLETDISRKICVDYSSPNIAKDLHVGHMRSTNIGESLVRMFELQGHKVDRINHIGDFGTQFGKIIQYLYEENPDFMIRSPSIEDLQRFYSEAKKRFDEDPEFKKNAYEKTKLLQNNDTEVVKAWNIICDISRNSFNRIYKELNVELEEKGESFYKDMLADVVKELDDRGATKIKDGLKYVECSKGVFIVQKSDGSYLYGTTDLAAIRYRLLDKKYDEIYYVVDKGQQDHFINLFEIAKNMGWIKDQKVVHIRFGLMLSNNKRIKSRDGNTVSLQSLLDDAIEETKTKFKDSDNIKKIAYGAIKYSDLSIDRTKDYEYSPDKMLSLKGNTILYQFYSYVRYLSVLRKAGDIDSSIDTDIRSKEEKDLCLTLLEFNSTFTKAVSEQKPSVICTYLYELSNKASVFFERCRCLEYDKDKNLINKNISRLKLVKKTKDIFDICFYILNVEPVKKI